MVGRFSSAVGTTRDDSKDRPPGACISYVVSVIGPASVCQRKAPLTSAIFLFVERCEAFAVILRAASPCHPPASRPAPDVHPRKGAGYHKNSSTKAKIQNDGNRNVDRAVFGGGRDYTGGIKCYSLHRALTVGCKSPFSGSCPRQSPRAAGESVLV